MKQELSFISGKSVILTIDGLKYVGDINAGDLVLTGNNTLGKVSKVEKRLSPLIFIKGHGHPALMVSSNKKILSSNYNRITNSETGESERKFIEPVWTNAKDVKGMFWASPISFLETSCPIEIDENIAWLMGAYLGNGYIKFNTVYFNTNHFREDRLIEVSEKLKLRLDKKQKGSIYEYSITHAVFVNWLKETLIIDNKKNIPFWVYGMPLKYRKQFFEGFVWGCGVFERKNYRFSIKNNKCLAIGMKLIAQSLGHSTALYLSTSKKNSKTSERWQIVAELSARSSVVIENNRFGLIREVKENNRKHIVYDIELENGNSLVVDGIIVKV